MSVRRGEVGRLLLSRFGGNRARVCTCGGKAGWVATLSGEAIVCVCVRERERVCGWCMFCLSVLCENMGVCVCKSSVREGMSAKESVNVK